jgi:hypothetical protein
MTYVVKSDAGQPGSVAGSAEGDPFPVTASPVPRSGRGGDTSKEVGCDDRGLGRDLGDAATFERRSGSFSARGHGSRTREGSVTTLGSTSEKLRSSRCGCGRRPSHLV